MQQLKSDEALERPSFEKIFESALDRGVCTSRVDLCERAGLTKQTFNHLRNGSRSSLQTWVRLAMAADLSPSGLFVPRFWRAGMGTASLRLDEDAMHRRRIRRVDWSKVRTEANAQLSSPTPLSLAQLAKHVQTDERYMRRALGNVAREVRNAGRDAATRELRKQVESVARLLTREVCRFRQAHKTISARSLARAIGRSHETIVFGLAMRRVATDVGLATLANYGRKRLVDRHIDSIVLSAHRL
jgi:hypothetical protein